MLLTMEFRHYSEKKIQQFELTVIGVVAHEPPGELSGGESGGAVGALRPRRPRFGRAAALLADACAPAPDTAAAPIGLVLFRLCNNIMFTLGNPQ